MDVNIFFTCRSVINFLNCSCNCEFDSLQGNSPAWQTQVKYTCTSNVKRLPAATVAVIQEARCPAPGHILSSLYSLASCKLQPFPAYTCTPPAVSAQIYIYLYSAVKCIRVIRQRACRAHIHNVCCLFNRQSKR